MLSIAMVVFMLSYGCFKLILQFNRSEFTVNQTRSNYYFDLEDSFSHLDGFNIAAGVVSYELGAPNFGVDPEIGQLKIYLKTWDINNSDYS